MPELFLRHLAAPLAAAAIASGPASAEAGDPLYAWTQYDTAGAPLIRAIVAAGDPCPAYASSAGSGTMSARATDLKSIPILSDFAGIGVCEATQASGASQITVGKIPLPAPPASLSKIALLGDTGCRLKGSDIQNCNGQGVGPEWNFADIAAAIASEAPDLVLHMGDMHYREYVTFCGTGEGQSATAAQANPECNGFDPATVGYSWASWKADFFDPAKPMLAAAPFVPVRGNHEECSDRAWRGWFLFFDPRPLPGDWADACQAPTGGLHGQPWRYTPPYALDLPGLRLILMDSSYIYKDYDEHPDKGMVALYGAEFSHIENLARKDATPAWLMTHRPFRAIASYIGSSGQEKITTTDQTLQDALAASDKGRLPDQIRLTLAGHVHLFEYLEFLPQPDGSRSHPPQIVFGAGGTKLDPGLAGGMHGLTLAKLQDLGADTQTFVTQNTFDYGIAVQTAQGWSITVKTLSGDSLTPIYVPN